jgi:hypothetical protein
VVVVRLDDIVDVGFCFEASNVRVGIPVFKVGQFRLFVLYCGTLTPTCEHCGLSCTPALEDWVHDTATLHYGNGDFQFQSRHETSMMTL